MRCAKLPCALPSTPWGGPVAPRQIRLFAQIKLLSGDPARAKIGGHSIRHHRISMYLAGILELWMLLAVSLWAQGSSARVLVFPDALRQEPSGSSSQAPANQNQPTAQDAPKSDSQSAAPSGQNQNTQPTQESK